MVFREIYLHHLNWCTTLVHKRPKHLLSNWKLLQQKLSILCPFSTEKAGVKQNTNKVLLKINYLVFSIISL